jgi:hypothetical protein
MTAAIERRMILLLCGAILAVVTRDDPALCVALMAFAVTAACLPSLILLIVRGEA